MTVILEWLSPSCIIALRLTSFRFFLDPVTGSPQTGLYQALASAAREKPSQPEERGFYPFNRGEMTFSFLNPKCEARVHQEGGCGVFALEKTFKDELVSMWGGKIIHKNELDPAMPRFTQRVLQVDEELYLLTAEEKEPNDCFNHSCDPNLGFFGQIGLVAMRDIDSGEELTFDYAMSDGGPYDEFQCNCGSENCRGKITGNDWRLPELWEKYKDYFSPYLARRIEKLRK